jgi:hypothetical protein
MVPVNDVIQGAETHDRLVEFVREVVGELVESGLFKALSARTPRSPPSRLDDADS